MSRLYFQYAATAFRILFQLEEKDYMLISHSVYNLLVYTHVTSLNSLAFPSRRHAVYNTYDRFARFLCLLKVNG